MKTRPLIITILIFAFISIWLEGCDIHKRTEVENRKLAEVRFERTCRMINYGTNEFIGPDLVIGRANTNDLEYDYTWKHKSLNLLIGCVVTESGDIAGGPGPIDDRKPVAPMPKRK
jgi:hypothetical protein